MVSSKWAGGIRRMAAAPWAVSTLLGLTLVVACSSSSAVEQANAPDAGTADAMASATIGASGGSVHLDEVTLTIPAGALPSPSQISVSRLAPESLSAAFQSNFVLYSGVYQFQPDGLQFQQPVTVTFAGADGSPLDAGAADTTYVFWSAPQTTAGYVPIAPVDGSTDSGQITHFSSVFLGAAKDIIGTYCNLVQHGQESAPCCSVLKLCGPGLSCQDGTCQCNTCVIGGHGGVCVELTDNQSCGSGGSSCVACSLNEYCNAAGDCACRSGVSCGSACCDEAEACVNGACQCVPDCTSGSDPSVVSCGTPIFAGNCPRGPSCDTGTYCEDGQSCVDGKCLCPGGQQACNGVCCPTGETCQSGACGCPAAEQALDCGGITSCEPLGSICCGAAVCGSGTQCLVCHGDPAGACAAPGLTCPDAGSDASNDAPDDASDAFFDAGLDASTDGGDANTCAAQGLMSLSCGGTTQCVANGSQCCPGAEGYASAVCDPGETCTQCGGVGTCMPSTQWCCPPLESVMCGTTRSCLSSGQAVCMFNGAYSICAVGCDVTTCVTGC